MCCILQRGALGQVSGIHIGAQLDQLCHSIQEATACTATVHFLVTHGAGVLSVGAMPPLA